jgi:hypothetical protein
MTFISEIPIISALYRDGFYGVLNKNIFILCEGRTKGEEKIIYFSLHNLWTPKTNQNHRNITN